MKTLNRNIKELNPKNHEIDLFRSERTFSLVYELGRFTGLRKVFNLGLLLVGLSIGKAHADQTGTEMPAHESSMVLDSSNAFAKNIFGQRWSVFRLKNFPITPGSDRATTVSSTNAVIETFAKSDTASNTWGAVIADRLFKDELGVSVDADFLNHLDVYLTDYRNTIVVEYFDLEGNKTSELKIKNRADLDKAQVFKYADNKISVKEKSKIIIRKRPDTIEMSVKTRYVSNVNSLGTADNEYNSLFTTRAGVTIPVASIPGAKRISVLNGFILNLDTMARLSSKEQTDQVASTGVAGNAGETTSNDSSAGSYVRKFNLNQINIYLQHQFETKHAQLNSLAYANLWAGGATSNRAFDEFGGQFNIAPHIDAPLGIKLLSLGAGSFTFGGFFSSEVFARGLATENTEAAKEAVKERIQLGGGAILFNNPLAHWQAARESGFYKHMALNLGASFSKGFKNTLRDKLLASGITLSEYENAFSMLGMAGITFYPERYFERGTKLYAAMPSFAKYEFMAAFLAANTVEHNLAVGYKFWRMQMIVNGAISTQYAGVLNATPENTAYSVGFEVRASLGE